MKKIKKNTFKPYQILSVIIFVVVPFSVLLIKDLMRFIVACSSEAPIGILLATGILPLIWVTILGGVVWFCLRKGSQGISVDGQIH